MGLDVGEIAHWLYVCFPRRRVLLEAIERVRQSGDFMGESPASGDVLVTSWAYPPPQVTSWWLPGCVSRSRWLPRRVSRPRWRPDDFMGVSLAPGDFLACLPPQVTSDNNHWRVLCVVSRVTLPLHHCDHYTIFALWSFHHISTITLISPWHCNHSARLAL